MTDSFSGGFKSFCDVITANLASFAAIFAVSIASEIFLCAELLSTNKIKYSCHKIITKFF